MLPVELWHYILLFLPVQDIISYARVSKHFNTLVKSEYLWDQLLTRDHPSQVQSYSLQLQEKYDTMSRKEFYILCSSVYADLEDTLILRTPRLDRDYISDIDHMLYSMEVDNLAVYLVRITCPLTITTRTYDNDYDTHDTVVYMETVKCVCTRSSYILSYYIPGTESMHHWLKYPEIRQHLQKLTQEGYSRTLLSHNHEYSWDIVSGTSQVQSLLSLGVLHYPDAKDKSDNGEIPD